MATTRWLPPCSPFVKVNVDASWTAANGDGFAGVVAQNSDGLFVAARRYRIRAPSVVAAEALAILSGYEFAISLVMDMVIIESDSKESIDCLRDSSKFGCWEAFPSLTKIRRIRESFQACRWSWIPRLAT